MTTMTQYGFIDYIISNCETQTEAETRIQSLIGEHLPDYEQSLIGLLRDLPEIFATRSRSNIIHVNFRPSESNPSNYPQ